MHSAAHLCHILVTRTESRSICVRVGAVQVAYMRLQQLLEAAERLGWSEEVRRERFRGPGGTPVVFILTPYRKQVFLCQQVLDALHALPDSLAHAIVVRHPSSMEYWR